MLQLLSSGIHTTLQDAGRFGYRNVGIPICGFMDEFAAARANRILNNESGAACIEFVHNGPILKFHSPTFIAISGAVCELALNGLLVKQDELIKIESGDVLKIGRTSVGNYGYVAIRGGFKSEIILGSKSYYSGITPYSRLTKKMILDYDTCRNIAENNNALATIEQPNTQIIKAFKGPEFDQLSEKVQNLFYTQQYSVSSLSNRMAYRIEMMGQAKGFEIISGPVQPGTVQLTPSGDFIVLMRDCQTTGGYARILQIDAPSINCLAQKRVNELFKLTIY